MVKIAILSDIHANKEALLEVIEDIKKRNCEEIYKKQEIGKSETDQKRKISKRKIILSK